MSSSTVEQIKGRLSIADVIGSYVKLEKAGANWKARCPFHTEKTPSFFVSPLRDSFYCFGCAKGGDIFTFVQDIEGVDFKGALKLLADRAGVEIRFGERENRSERDTHRAAMADAVAFYHAALKKRPDILAYLHGRGVTDTTIDDFRIGYAPAAWRGLYESLGRTHSVETLVAVGLAAVSKGRAYDRFRNRIMFPISDATGNPIAFSGRMFGAEDSPDNKRVGQVPGKYVNSPDTPLFDKSRALFAFDRAKMAIRSQNTAVLVEGQFDVVLSHQAGITNAVAVSGTALTAAHVQTITRLASTVVMAFDADAAGIRAGERAVTLLLEHGADIRAARLPAGKDPADLAGTDPAAWQKAVAEAAHIVDFFSEVLLDTESDERARRVAIVEKILPYIALLERATERAHFIGRIASRFGIPEEPLWQDLSAFIARQKTARAAAPPQSPVTRAEIPTRIDTLMRRIVGLHWLGHAEGVADVVSEIAGSPALESYLKKYEPVRNTIIFETELQYGTAPPPKEISLLLDHLRYEVTRQELDAAMRRLKRFEIANDPVATETEIRRCNELSRQIATYRNTFTNEE